jgi:hypothetical protein
MRSSTCGRSCLSVSIRVCLGGVNAPLRFSISDAVTEWNARAGNAAVAAWTRPLTNC